MRSQIEQKLADEPMKEVEFLRRLGLREDEISYLVWLKKKESKRSHWKN